MVRLSFLLTLLGSLTIASAQPTPALTLDRVTALAKSYLRDSAEVPMNVAVTTVVTDQAGKLKRRAQSTVRLVFRGYNPQTGKFGFNGNSGWFNTWALRDSISGEFAAYLAGTFLAPRGGATDPLKILQPAQPGQPFLITLEGDNCPKVELAGQYLFPRKACGSSRFGLSLDGGNDLLFQHFTFDAAGLPVPAKVAYLDDVQLLSLRFDVDFQKGFLPGDPNPFLWPKRTVTTVSTDKGKIVITNEHTPQTAKANSR